MRRLLAIPTIILLSTGMLAGCGSQQGPVGDLVVQLGQGQFVNLAPSGDGKNVTAATPTVFTATFTVNTAGFVIATVNWTSASNVLLPGIFPGTCTADAIVSHACAPVLGSGSRTLTATSAQAGVSLGAGSYVLGIVNLGPGAETGTYEFGQYIQGSPSAF
jgi:hypothetical protein